LTDKRSSKRGGEGSPPEPDVFRVTLHAPDRAALARAVRELGLDIDHQHPADERGAKRVEIDGFLTQHQIDLLKGRGWELRVGENLSAIGRERQKEVGRGDRFEGGRKRPKGLGRKA
jgi:hypothetical protein